MCKRKMLCGFYSPKNSIAFNGKYRAVLRVPWAQKEIMFDGTDLSTWIKSVWICFYKELVCASLSHDTE